MTEKITEMLMVCLMLACSGGLLIGVGMFLVAASGRRLDPHEEIRERINPYVPK